MVVHKVQRASQALSQVVVAGVQLQVLLRGLGLPVKFVFG
jgi:hypothetical protein